MLRHKKLPVFVAFLIAIALTFCNINSVIAINEKSKISAGENVAPRLESLGVKKYDFSGFNPEKTKYSTSVPNSVTAIEVYAIPRNGVHYSVTGNKSLQVGENTVTVTAISPNGKNTFNYYITVIREEKEEPQAESKVEEQPKEEPQEQAKEEEQPKEDNQMQKKEETPKESAPNEEKEEQTVTEKYQDTKNKSLTVVVIVIAIMVIFILIIIIKKLIKRHIKNKELNEDCEYEFRGIKNKLFEKKDETNEKDKF